VGAAAIALVAAARQRWRCTGRATDSCLYHVATIRWFEQYPIVPGLGHVHLRLAFNHAYYLYASLFDVDLSAARRAPREWTPALAVLAPPACCCGRRRRAPSAAQLELLTVAWPDDVGPALGCNCRARPPTWPSRPPARSSSSSQWARIDGAELTPFRLRAIGVIAVAA